MAKRSLRRYAPEVGAECLNWARSDLCGGRSAMTVPTAIGPDLLTLSSSRFDPKLTPRASLSFFIEHIAQNASQPRSFKLRIVAHCNTVGLPWRGLKPAFGIYSDMHF